MSVFVAPQIDATLTELIREWCTQHASPHSSLEWHALAPSTQKRSRLVLDRIERRWGHFALSAFEDQLMVEHILEWRDSLASTPRAADELVRVLRGLITFGRRYGWLAYDATAGITELGAQDRSDIFWSEEDITVFRRKAEAMDQQPVADAVRFVAATGLGLQDMLKVEWSHVGEFTITKPVHHQSGRPRRKLTLPRLPGLNKLLQELAARPRRDGVTTVLVNGAGKSWGRAKLSQEIKKIRDAAGIKHIDPDTEKVSEKTLNDLRKTFALRLLAYGLADDEVASVMNWTSENVCTLRVLGVHMG